MMIPYEVSCVNCWGSGNSSNKQYNDDVYEQFEFDLNFDGERYITNYHLPFKPHADIVPDHFYLSLRRLGSLERKFSSNERLKEQYQEILSVLFEREYYRIVSPGCPGKVHYLSHNAVVKNEKVRIVFDGSANLNGPSFIDSLYNGPCLLTCIYDIVLHFRLFPIGITADIRQAFLNIMVFEEQGDFQRFLWRDSNHDLITYRFLRILFGLTSSPFLLNGTFRYHMEH